MSEEPPAHIPVLTPIPQPSEFSPASGSHNIFIGPEGLRPAWSLLTFLAVAFIIYMFSGSALIALPAIQHALRASAGRPVTLTSILVNDGPLLLAVSVATWLMAKVEGQSLGVYGLGGRRRLPHFFLGLFWGASFLGSFVFLLWKAGLLYFEGRLLFGADIEKKALVWTIGFLLVSLTEEFTMRGYLQFTLTRTLSGLLEPWFQPRSCRAVAFWIAALCLSFLFGAGHRSNPGESPIGLLSAGLIGLIFCLTLWRTGSLWWALGFHASWDWAQSFLFGVADSGTMVEGHLLASHPVGKVILSGGATGPEGSIFILPVMAAIALLVFWTLPARPAVIPEALAVD